VDRGHRWEENQHRKTVLTLLLLVAQRLLLFAAIYRLGPRPSHAVVLFATAPAVAALDAAAGHRLF